MRDLKLPQALVELRVADAHHEVAEGTVDVLAAALQGRVVGSVDQVDRHVPGLHTTWHNMAQHVTTWHSMA